MSEHLSSYGKIFTLGHRQLAKLFDGPVVIQEKIDGSQFSFGVLNGVLCCRSKGQQIVLEAPGMFAAAISTARRLHAEGKLLEGRIYRCEYLSKPKHNALAYSRVPRGNLVLFDVERQGIGEFLPMDLLPASAELLGVEPVPVLFEGPFDLSMHVSAYLDRESCLGGSKIEGVVIKNYNQFGEDKKIVVGKLVSEAFKEVHRHEWKKSNPGQSEIVQQIIADYRTSPRWQKAVQRLRDEGKIRGEPEDIGLLIREIQLDTIDECEAEIAERLFEHFWPKIARGIISGFPEWYKGKLADLEEAALVDRILGDSL
jgi:hypothetical protein